MNGIAAGKQYAVAFGKLGNLLQVILRELSPESSLQSVIGVPVLLQQPFVLSQAEQILDGLNSCCI